MQKLNLGKLAGRYRCRLGKSKEMRSDDHDLPLYHSKAAISTDFDNVEHHGFHFLTGPKTWFGYGLAVGRCTTLNGKFTASWQELQEFENGREYYQLDGRDLRPPVNPIAMPSRESLQFHAEQKFR